MKLMRVGAPGSEIPVVETDSGRYDLSSVVDDIDAAFWRDGGVRRVRDALAAEALPAMDVEGLRIGPPIARPGAVLCIGQNYAAHAAESGDAPPSVPILFHKHPNTVVGPFDDVLMPPGALAMDWEVELGVVIGQRCSYLTTQEEALAAIGGYVVSNDVSERDYQIRDSGGQWSKGKNAPTFNPLGPYLVTADEVADPQQLQLSSRVNGEARQDSNTADMIFSVAEIVRHLSQYVALDPGDLINTGTPQGVALSGRFPYLAIGDRMELSIEGLGTQRQAIRPS
ncbi:fumarylacetoacetate hydrolase family protein [Tsukamurella tyrosinosolvens]|uniref:fumarylacetoacetate hydrolase family protein n=1 Tax=Tsukamurella tyrosinosolvens TaxID=57704 RepID=UPI000DF6847E|nr:fumarylacetoacetate hydrolase family protein [Tsukamurella tyrosinosolvens]RDB48564.1 FAA hydrolase family protein [Tsukamurella tyrosinosolvens]